MTTPTHRSVRDQLVAEIELVSERLETLQSRIAAESVEVRDRFEGRTRQIAERAERLAATTKDWMAVKIGSAGAIEDLGDAVDAIEADLDAARETTAANYRSRLDRQLRVWRSRAERLRVQEALAELELRDDLGAVSGRLRDARARALVELRRTGADAKETVIDLRGDLDELLDDARRVVDRAVDALIEGDRD
jgi:ElaB/YqjD/DUF883 family membrane-anchored ribosome-binding protein